MRFCWNTGSRVRVMLPLRSVIALSPARLLKPKDPVDASVSVYRTVLSLRSISHAIDVRVDALQTVIHAELECDRPIATLVHKLRVTLPRIVPDDPSRNLVRFLRAKRHIQPGSSQGRQDLGTGVTDLNLFDIGNQRSSPDLLHLEKIGDPPSAPLGHVVLHARVGSLGASRIPQ